MVLFGAICDLCGVRDDADDNVDANHKRAWGYPPDPTSRSNVGSLCWVCFKVYRARFRARFITTGALKAAWGTNPDLLDAFQYFCNLATTAMKQAGLYLIEWPTSFRMFIGCFPAELD